MEWSELTPMVTAAAAVGALVVAVVGLSSRFVSNAIKKQDENQAERMKAFGDLQDERMKAFSDLQDERMKAFGERMATFDERMATFDERLKTFDERLKAFSDLQDERLKAFGDQIRDYEKRNVEEHAALGERIDKVDAKVDKANELLHEIHVVVARLDERRSAAAGGGPKGDHAA